MAKVRWGIVSAGNISHTFAKDIIYAKNADLVAVAARQLSAASAFASQYHIGKAYQGYEALFADPDVDAVYISTPHTLHFDNAKAALLAGKHVLCEKPITTSPEHLLQLSALAKQQGLFLMEAMWTYFLPAIQQAKQWVDDGRIGDVTHIKADFGYPMPYDPNSRPWNINLAGGCLLDMGIYPLAFNYLFNSSTDYSPHIIGRRAPNGADRDVVMALDYGKQVSQLHTSFDVRLPNCGAVVGTKGHIIIPDFFRAREVSLYHIDERVEHFVDNRQGSGFEFEITTASQAILEGKQESPIMPHSTSLHLQQQMQDILAAF
ncbi:Gfo/Idh/MocA family protein [Thalassotalea maritima]|uniref:Gfo/Idh/MocA family protein n=1 Tax=Thalassotalea maritima TaxID=3242416 RepID=UPI003529439E